MRYRCQDCAAFFNVKTDSMMQGSKLPLSKWALAIYLLMTSNKGVSSVQLAKQVGVTQKTAWYLAHRIRRAFKVEGYFEGPVEVDETYIGGHYKNFKKLTRAEKLAGDAKTRRSSKQGLQGKTILLGMVDRESRQVAVRVVPYTASETLKGFVLDYVTPTTRVFSDGHGGYKGLPNHTALKQGLAYFSLGGWRAGSHQHH